MEQTVYIDLYFLINFSMDLLCLFLAARLLSYRMPLWRGALTALLGGAYACLSLFFDIGGVWGLAVDLAACAFLGFVAMLKGKNIKQCLGFSLVFAATSVVLGGFMTVLFSFFNRIGLDRLFGTEDQEGGGVSVWVFAFLALISAVISALGGKVFRKKSARRECTVKLTYEKKSITLNALCDSGNLLREPISGKLCIVAEAKEIEKILPYEISAVLGTNSTSGDIYATNRIRIIPTQTVSGEGMMYAIRFDSIRIDAGKGESEVDAFVALGNIGKAAEGKSALVPSELMSGIA